MAVHVLENEYLKVEINDSGAQLSSVYDKEAEEERLHDADPAVWNRHAPILFPFVGRVTGGVYRIGEKEYEMKTQHGFARDMDFECVEKTEEKVTHRLLPTEATKKSYPFEFELLVTHTLDSENPRMLHISWEIKNNGSELMYYSIGGHPGFTVPEKDPKAKEEYYLEFPGKDRVEYFGVNSDSGFAEPSKTKTLALEKGFVKFCEDVYTTLIFDNPGFDKVRICRPDKTPYVTMECSAFGNFGIWAKESGSFICLEPWVGRTDDHGFAGCVNEKINIQTLEAGESKVIAHTVEFHK